MRPSEEVDEYTKDILDYGGLYWTRAEVIRDMQRMGQPQGAIDRWFQGYELATEIRARKSRTGSVTPGETI